MLKSSRDGFNVFDNFNVSSIKTANDGCVNAFSTGSGGYVVAGRKKFWYATKLAAVILQVVIYSCSF